MDLSDVSEITIMVDDFRGSASGPETVTTT